MQFTHLLLLMFQAVVTHGAVKADHGGAHVRHPHVVDSSGDTGQKDTLLQHMSQLYDKSNRESRLIDGNTVRSFLATPDPSDQRTMFRLNLTTLQDSEVILSVTFHFLLERHPPPKPWLCKRFRSSFCRSPLVRPALPVSLLLRSVSDGPEVSSEVSSQSTASLLGNVTFHPHRRGAWHMKDLTQVVKTARARGHLLLSLQMDLGSQSRRSPAEALAPGTLPYLLVYANDEALGDPNSVSASLLRYHPSLEAADLSSGRVRRDLIQTNELPDVHLKPQRFRKEDMLEKSWNLGLNTKMKPGKKDKKKKSHEDVVKDEAERESEQLQFEEVGRRQERRNNKRLKTSPESPLLIFDEKTMRKARRRMSTEASHRGCSRRNLRVDFADIGWSEWVISPKAFEAYYCAGTCGFPMTKVSRPSNHATIQSIVRVVGIVPGIPEPCCVPERMSPLPVLYRDESKNPVLKVYPNMSVQSCSCR